MMTLRNTIIAFCAVVLTAAGLSAVDLSLKLTEGNSYTYSGNADISLVQNLPGPSACDIHYRGTISSQLSYLVKKVYEDGTADIEVKLIDPVVKFSVSCEGNESPMSFNFQFDSTQKSENEMKEVQAIKSALDCLNNKIFAFKINTKGEVLDMEGGDGLAKKVQNQLSNNNLVPKETAQELCAMITPKAVEFLMRLMTQHIPESDVAVGETWDESVSLGNIAAEQMITLVSADKHTIVLEEKTTFELGQEGSVFKGEELANYRLSPKDNWITSVDSQTKFEGKQTLSIPASESPFEIETSLNAKVTLERLSLK